MGCMYQEYTTMLVMAGKSLPPQAVTGNGLSFMVGRLSYTFAFTGKSARPNMPPSYQFIPRSIVYSYEVCIELLHW